MDRILVIYGFYDKFLYGFVEYCRKVPKITYWKRETFTWSPKTRPQL
jgi:hypothetical protein